MSAGISSRIKPRHINNASSAIGSQKALKSVFWTSRVDYCNSVLFQTAAVNPSPLQLVMNAAARLVVKKSDSITPTLRDTLHWLLVRERIDFKLCLVVYKCLHQLAALYLESMIFTISAVSTRRHLYGRQVMQGDLVVPRTRTVGFDPRSFSVAGSSLWNTLPSDMKQSSLFIAQFCSQLKPVMFVRSFYARAQPSQSWIIRLG